MSLKGHIFKFSHDAAKKALINAIKHNYYPSLRPTEQSQLAVYFFLKTLNGRVVIVDVVDTIDGNVVSHVRGQRGELHDLFDNCEPVLDSKELAYAKMLFV